MKKYRSCWILLLLLAMTTTGYSQLTYVATAPPLTGGNGQTGITFNVKAINPITIEEVYCVFASATSYSVTVWYHPTDSINGAPTVNTTNGWVALGPYSITATSTTTPTLVASSLGLSFNAGTVHGFHIAITSGTITYTTGPSSSGTVFGDANMYINTGTNCGYGGSPPTSAFYIRQFNGKIGYHLSGPPCPGPTGLAASNILSTSATVSWNAVSGSTGYDYAVTTSATPPATSGWTSTTNTSASKTGLTPSTVYYLHVRNKCSSINFSPWATYSFTTLPPCEPPVGFNVTNLTPTSATINWSVWLSALSYDYIVDQSNQSPTTSTGIANTMLTTAPATPLTENTWYFVHIRSLCAGNEISSWSLDSFLTPIPCRPPGISISNINTDEAVAYWDPVPTATGYEYAITTSATPPSVGTKYEFTSLHTPALFDGREYFIHVRSHCSSIGIESTSDWATASFKTFPTSVSSLEDGFSIAAYPNPVKDILTIQVNGSRRGEAVLNITDITGKAIKTTAIAAEKTNINMNDLPAGIYIVTYTDQLHTETIKLNKQ